MNFTLGEKMLFVVLRRDNRPFAVQEFIFCDSVLSMDGHFYHKNSARVLEINRSFVFAIYNISIILVNYILLSSKHN